MVGWVRQNYDRSKAARSQLELQWAMNMAFYYGKQYSEFIPQLRKLGTPKAPPYRVRHVANRIRPLVRTELARITSQKPNASVVPASSEDEDLFAAQAGEQVWESVYARKKIHRVFSRAAWWTVVTGNGFLKTYWDKGAVDKDSGQPGDLAYGNVTPFHLFVPDLREEEIEEQPFLIHAYTKPLEWINHFWGQFLDPDKKLVASTVSANEILQDIYLNLNGSSTMSEPDSCLILETWIKPGAHKSFPSGGLITIVDNQVVQYNPEGFPYEHGQYPYTKFDGIPTGKFYSESSIFDVIPLQREYNRTRSQIIEAKNRMGKPQLLAPKGTVDPSKITTEPGQVIFYNPGLGAPTPLPLQPLPAYVTNDLSQTLMDFEDITGQHQVSKGSAPPGVTAATAISFLQEKDDAISTHTYQSVETGMEKIAGQTLSLCVQYWDTERLVKTSGTDEYFDALMLSGSSIATGTDIRMEGGSALPVSKAARQAFIMDLMKMGMIDPNEGLKLMEIGGVQKLYENLKRDERQAQRENLRFKRLTDEDITMHQQEFQMAQQQASPETMDVQTQQPIEMPPVIPVNTWDNHMAHIKIHNDYRKSQSFELLPQSIKVEIESHVNQHKAAMAADFVEQQVQQMQNDPTMSGAGNQFSGQEGLGQPQ